MASLSFQGETHDEIVLKVKRWLQSTEEGWSEDRALTPVEAVERGAELTKDALRVLAAVAPAPMASSEVVKTLTTMGYKATDQTRDAVVAGLDSLDQLTGGGVVQRAEGAANAAMWQMSAAVAKQLLKSLRTPPT
jgi:hypothetical protein